jgi:signal transduction histidine kinase
VRGPWAAQAAEIERLCHPFERLGNARTGHATGHGLGLAIVHAIATAHGAGLEICPGTAGGLDARVCFPA